MTKFGLRERKRAQLRASVTDTLASLLESRPLSTITVDELCERVGVSKVTFFHHFVHKEQVLDYYVCRWQYLRSYDLARGGRVGWDGLEALFRSVGDEPVGQPLVVALVSYYTRLSEPPPVPEVSPCEYAGFSQEAFALGVVPLGLGELLDRLMAPLPFDDPQGPVRLKASLVALFYGVPLQRHLMGLPASGLTEAYRSGLATLSLTGRPKQRDLR